MDVEKYVDQLSEGVRPYMRRMVRFAAASGANSFTIMPENFTVVMRQPNESEMCCVAMRDFVKRLGIQQTGFHKTVEGRDKDNHIEYTVTSPIQVPVGQNRNAKSFVIGEVSLDYRDHGFDNEYHGRALIGTAILRHPSRAGVTLEVCFGPTGAFFGDDYSFCVDAHLSDLRMGYSDGFSAYLHDFDRVISGRSIAVSAH